MITLFRIDERLIHGQVAIKWSKHSCVDHIVVANDNASNNTIVQKTLKMAAPAGVKTAIKSVDDSINLLNDPRTEKMKILVLVDNPSDALILTNNINNIPYINVGNFGRIAQEKIGEKRTRYAGNLYCYEEEKEIFGNIINTGMKCVYQTTPEDGAEDISKLLDL